MAMDRWRVRTAVAVVVIALTGHARAGAPIGEGHSACSSCHNPSVATATTVPATAAAHSATAAEVRCQSCHPAQDPELGVSIRNPHHALECVACHDAHTNDAPYRLRQARIQSSAASADFDPQTRLCVSCHAPTGEFRGTGGGFVRHPVGVPAPRHDAHVVTAGANVASAGPSDPPDRVLLPLMSVRAAGGPRSVIGCGTCHSIHASPNPFQLRWAHEQQITACTSCHAGLTDDAVAATLPRSR
jgi:predicted CXXCH cytochrome family protein